MKVVRVADEADLPALVRTMMPNVDDTALTTAVESIKAANPAVDLTRLTPGSLVFVPEVTPAAAADAEVTSGPLGSLQAMLDSAVGQLRDLAGAQQSAAAAHYQRVANALTDPALRDAAGATPTIADALTAVRTGLDAQADQLKQQVQLVEEMTKAWTEQFSYLSGFQSDSPVK